MTTKQKKMDHIRKYGGFQAKSFKESHVTWSCLEGKKQGSE